MGQSVFTEVSVVLLSLTRYFPDRKSTYLGRFSHIKDMHFELVYTDPYRKWLLRFEVFLSTGHPIVLQVIVILITHSQHNYIVYILYSGYRFRSISDHHSGPSYLTF